MIALLSDFGNSDTYVAAMKASIYKLYADAKVLDIHHHVSPQNIYHGAFDLQLSAIDMPPKTTFVVVVDPGVGSERKGVLLKTKEHQFVGPDNGVFTPILDHVIEKFEINYDHNFFSERSFTFHGRDVFAPLAAMVELGEEQDWVKPFRGDLVTLQDLWPKRTSNSFIGSFVKSDHFGNLISNIHKRDLDDSDIVNEIKVLDKSLAFDFVETYAQLSEHQLGGLWGSSGYFELCLKGDSSQEKTQLDPPCSFELKFK